MPRTARRRLPARNASMHSSALRQRVRVQPSTKTPRLSSSRMRGCFLAGGGLCANQTSGAPRHRHDNLTHCLISTQAAASSREAASWRAAACGSRPATPGPWEVEVASSRTRPHHLVTNRAPAPYIFPHKYIRRACASHHFHSTRRRRPGVAGSENSCSFSPYMNCGSLIQLSLIFYFT